MAAMTTRERFRAAMNFQPVDRLPAVEWAPWWDKTVNRWYDEGLPRELADNAIREYLGLDLHHWIWIGPPCALTHPERSHAEGFLESIDEYDGLAAPLHDPVQIDRQALGRAAEDQRRGTHFVWFQIDGFFWFPRKVFGIERHLYAFYDHPDLMHRINQDLCDYNIRLLDELCKIVTPDACSIAEDMSYNHGPMLSKAMFDEFLAPYYRRLVPALKKHGIIATVDSDGLVNPMIPWLEEVGVEGCDPLERQAGVDVAQIRRDHPRWRMVGGFDKTVMHLGEAAMRREFERLLPVMRSGGLIPSVDHQTPPDVSLENYRIYIKLLHEYCEKGAPRKSPRRESQE